MRPPPPNFALGALHELIISSCFSLQELSASEIPKLGSPSCRPGAQSTPLARSLALGCQQGSRAPPSTLSILGEEPRPPLQSSAARVPKAQPTLLLLPDMQLLSP